MRIDFRFSVHLGVEREPGDEPAEEDSVRVRLSDVLLLAVLVALIILIAQHAE